MLFDVNVWLQLALTNWSFANNFLLSSNDPLITEKPDGAANLEWGFHCVLEMKSRLKKKHLAVQPSGISQKGPCFENLVDLSLDQIRGRGDLEVVSWGNRMVSSPYWMGGQDSCWMVAEQEERHIWVGYSTCKALSWTARWQKLSGKHRHCICSIISGMAS